MGCFSCLHSNRYLPTGRVLVGQVRLPVERGTNMELNRRQFVEGAGAAAAGVAAMGALAGVAVADEQEA